MEVYINGKFYKKEEAAVSVFDHGLLYGDGIFEGIRVYNRRIFKLKEHLERLYKSAKAILLEIPLPLSELARQVSLTVERNAIEDGYIRLVVTRGTGDLGIDPAKCKEATIIIIAGTISLYPDSYYTEGTALITSSIRRVSPDNFDTRIKSLNYLNNILAKLEARQAGCLEAIMLNRDGFVAECTVDNIFIVKEGNIYTPSTDQGCLEGITRETVMEVAKEEGVPCIEKPLTQYDIYIADEMFITGTGAEMLPVTKVDGRIIGSGKPGEVTNRIRSAFKRFVERM